MSYSAIAVGAPEWWIPPDQVDADQPAQFKVAGLDGAQQASIFPEIIIDGRGNITFTATGIRILFEFGLLDWKHITDADGNEIPYPGNALEAQRMLAYRHQCNIATEIFNRSRVDEEDKKKS
jgi:hypothetical protein